MNLNEIYQYVLFIEIQFVMIHVQLILWMSDLNYKHLFFSHFYSHPKYPPRSFTLKFCITELYYYRVK